MSSANTSASAATVAEQLAQYASVTWEPGDLIEIRPLHADGRGMNQNARAWLPASELPGIADKLARVNASGSNMYAGVCPRTRDGGGKIEDVALARVLWADFDHMTPEAAGAKAQAAGAPPASMAVNTGHGAHLFWKLTAPLDRHRLAEVMRVWVERLGADQSVKDPARILRLPGFVNHKPPVATAELVYASPGIVYSVDELLACVQKQAPTAQLETGGGALPASVEIVQPEPQERAVSAPETTKPGEIPLPERIRLYIDKMEGSPQGGRNAACFKVACALVKDWSLSDADALEWLTLFDTLKNTPPLSGEEGRGRSELEQVIQNARKYGKHTPGAALAAAVAASSPWTPTDVVGAMWVDGQPAPVEAATPSSWTPVDLSRILSGEHEPDEPAILKRNDGICLLYPGKMHSIHGESESGKSWVALIAAAETIKAGKNVAYIDYESDAQTICDRLLLLGVTPPEITRRLTYVQPESPPAGDVAFQRLLNQKITLAVIDGVNAALATCRSETKDTDSVTVWFTLLPKPLARFTGAAVLMIDHVTKGTEGRGRFAIGSQAKMAGLDGAAYCCEPVEPLAPGKTGVVELRVGKDRPGAIRAHCSGYSPADRTQLAARITIDSTGNAIAVTVAAPDIMEPLAALDGPQAVMQSVLSTLAGAKEPMSMAALAKKIGGRKATVIDAVRHLTYQKMVAKKESNNGKKSGINLTAEGIERIGKNAQN